MTGVGWGVGRVEQDACEQQERNDKFRRLLSEQPYPFRIPIGVTPGARSGQVGDVTSDARGSGARYNAGKPAMDLIPLRIIARSFAGFDRDYKASDVWSALMNLGSFQETGRVVHLDAALRGMGKSWEVCAQVFDYGCDKYAEWNWAKGMPWSVPLACGARHAIAILREEVDDKESQLPHRGHFMCNLVMLRQFVDTYPEGNDLPSPDLFRSV